MIKTTSITKLIAPAALTAAAVLAVCPAAMADPPAQTFWETVDGQSTRFGIKDAEPGITPAGTRVAGHVIYMGLPKADKGTKAHIDIPESVTHDGVTYGVSRIGEYAFQDDTALASVSIPEGVEKIYMGAFYGCTSLKTVSIPKSMTYIGYSSFFNCSSLTDIDLSHVKTAISYRSFAGCKSLNNVKLSSRLDYVGTLAFGWTGISKITVNAAIVSNGAFSRCKNLKEVTVSKNVKEAYSYALIYNDKLKTITIKSSKLDKASARKLLRGSTVKTVKVPKKLVSKYKAYYAKPITPGRDNLPTVKVKVKAL